MNTYAVHVEFSHPVMVEADSFIVDDDSRVVGFFDEDDNLIHAFNTWLHVTKVNE